MQLLAKFKKILYMWRILFNFTKSCISSCLLKFYNKKKFHVPFFKYKRLKLKLRVFLGRHSVAIVTHSVTKIIPTCSPMIGPFFGTMIIASTDKER